MSQAVGNDGQAVPQGKLEHIHSSAFAERVVVFATRREVRLSCAYYSGLVQEPLGSNGFSSSGLCRMSQATGNDGQAVPQGKPEHIHFSAFAERVVVFATRR
ncbi:unnamed protein product [Cuscuta campestris]|uniref:Uncharacterized protein n=1 Tax=Cuscuta campestris TaxID=132261 RepID=A0A484M9T1_9ASTE|nr:unnamed protein product [Cuscuta campestris]